MASLPVPYEAEPEGMDDTELVSILAQHEARSIGYSGADDDITAAQELALKYYEGTMDDVPAMENGSSVCDGTVALVIDNALAAILEPFVSSDETVRFSPRGPEDVAVAEQATEYVNYIFNCDNPGFLILHNWFKDAFLAKLGVVKVQWEDRPRVEAQEVPLTDELQAAFVRQQPNYMGEENGIAMVGQIVPDGRVIVTNIPPEEFRISANARSVDDADYCAHVPSNVTRSDLLEMGFDGEVVEGLPAWDGQESSLADARNDDVGETAFFGSNHKPNDRVNFRDEYVKLDYDGDGVAEMRRIMRVNEVILSNEEVDGNPFAALCPIPAPHKVYGHSLADRAIQEQRIATVLWRQSLDNLYKSNNPRPIVGERAERLDGSTSDGLEDNAPGAAIPVRDVSQLRFDAVPFTAAHSLPMLELVEKKAEENTGISRAGQGLDSNALRKSGQMTATEMSLISQGKNARTKMIARIFAETGVSRLFKLILTLVSKHQQGERIIRLRNQFVPIDPRGWPEMDVSISVGLGIGDKQEQVGQAMTVLQTMQQVAGSPYASLFDQKNVYNAIKRLFTSSGIKNTDDFLNEPQEGMEQPQQPSPEQMKVEAEAQLQSAKLQGEQQLAELRIQLQAQEQAAKQQLAREQAEFEAQLARDKARFEAELAAWKAEQEAKRKSDMPDNRVGGDLSK
jgi:hypothetical protein